MSGEYPIYDGSFESQGDVPPGEEFHPDYPVDDDGERVDGPREEPPASYQPDDQEFESQHPEDLPKGDAHEPDVVLREGRDRTAADADDVTPEVPDQSKEGMLPDQEEPASAEAVKVEETLPEWLFRNLVSAQELARDIVARAAGDPVEMREVVDALDESQRDSLEVILGLGIDLENLARLSSDELKAFGDMLQEAAEPVLHVIRYTVGDFVDQAQGVAPEGAQGSAAELPDEFQATTVQDITQSIDNIHAIMRALAEDAAAGPDDSLMADSILTQPDRAAIMHKQYERLQAVDAMVETAGRLLQGHYEALAIELQRLSPDQDAVDHIQAKIDAMLGVAEEGRDIMHSIRKTLSRISGTSNN